MPFANVGVLTIDDGLGANGHRHIKVASGFDAEENGWSDADDFRRMA